MFHLLAFRQSTTTGSSPRWLETWFALLLLSPRACAGSEELGDCFLPAFEAKILWTSWAAAVGVLGVGVLGLTGEKPFPWYSPHMSSEDFFLALFCIASWTLCFLRSSKEKCSVHSARRGSVTSSCCLDWARNCDWHQSDPFLPHQWQNGLSVPTIKP